MSTISRGRFVWHDLMTKDLAAAEDFYTNVIGWGTQPWNGPMPYTMWTANGAPLGGLMAMPPGAEAPPHWLAYLSTPDTADTVAQAKELGARVHVEPKEIPDVGTFAVLLDPQGAAFAVYTPLRDKFADDSAPRVGEFSWHELATTDSAGAIDFYTKLFGWEERGAFDMGGGWMYRMYGRGDTELGGMFNKTPDMPGPPAWLNYIMVDDVDEAVHRVKTHGGQVLNGPMEVPGGDWIAQCLDPQGAVFAVHAKPKAA